MNKEKKQTQRRHLYALDGLRGIAGVGVITYHFCNVFVSCITCSKYFNHGYLNVDFFYMVTGFVLSFAYDKRKDTLTFWNFMKKRILRLQPMVIITTIIASFFLRYYYAPSPRFCSAGETPWKQRLILILLSALNIPAPQKYSTRTKYNSFPLNPPQWSLEFEYIGNIVYALILRHLSTTVIGILTGIMGITLISAVIIRDHGDIHAGFTLTEPHEAVFGLIRLFYPIMVGQLVSRLVQKKEMEEEKKREKKNDDLKERKGIPHAFLLCSLIIILYTITPRVGGQGGPKWMNATFDLIIVLLIQPLIIYLAVNESKPSSLIISICSFLGNISFSLYLTHYLFVDFMYCYVKRGGKGEGNDITIEYAWPLLVGLDVLCVAVALFFFEVVESPLQNMLSCLMK